MQEKKEDEKIDWSKWSFWLAIILFFISVGMWTYQTYFHEKSSNLTFELISNEEVLTLKEDIPNLNILYNNTNLKKSKKNISILTFKVKNSGKKSILTNHYDDNKPFGFVIEKGEILTKPNIITTSDEYYFIKPFSEIKKDTILFKKLIIDSGSYFDVKCLIIHKLGVKPVIKPIGKIAGISQFEVKEISKTKVNQPSYIYFISISLILVLLSILFQVYLLGLKRYSMRSGNLEFLKMMSERVNEKKKY